MTQGFFAYLIELRRRLLYCVYSVVLLFAFLFYFSADLFHLLAKPLLQFLPAEQGLIATGVTAPLLTPLKLSLVVSIFLSVPFILYQVWAFITPALRAHEKRLVWLLLYPSIGLFYVGTLFAYSIVFPLVFKFFSSVVPAGVSFLPDITQYLQFTLKLFFAFGIAFEVPIMTLVLIWSGVVSADKLAQQRPYVIVLAFVLGMLLTPPDVISQVLLAVPMWLLFELGLLLARVIKLKPQQYAELA